MKSLKQQIRDDKAEKAGREKQVVTPEEIGSLDDMGFDTPSEVETPPETPTEEPGPV